jgi:hypothetical protein
LTAPDVCKGTPVETNKGTPVETNKGTPVETNKGTCAGKLRLTIDIEDTKLQVVKVPSQHARGPAPVKDWGEKSQLRLGLVKKGKKKKPKISNYFAETPSETPNETSSSVAKEVGVTTTVPGNKSGKASRVGVIFYTYHSCYPAAKKKKPSSKKRATGLGGQVDIKEVVFHTT